jgi:hypothetical protein
MLVYWRLQQVLLARRLQFKSLVKAEQYLKPGITFKILDELAMRISNNESAIQLRAERNKLFNLIFEQDRKQA